MKILITENKRYQLAYKVLDDTLSKLHREDYEDNKGMWSISGNHQIIFEDRNGKVVMRYTEKYDRLEVRYDIWGPLSIFSFSDEELERVIHWWFKDRLRIDPDSVMLL
jgi:hypothetical protein